MNKFMFAMAVANRGFSWYTQASKDGMISGAELIELAQSIVDDVLPLLGISIKIKVSQAE